MSAAPDELDHACREARDFAFHFRVSYDIFLFIMKVAKLVFSATVVVLIWQPSRNIYLVHFKGGIYVLSAIPHSTYFGRAPFLVGNTYAGGVHKS